MVGWNVVPAGGLVRVCWCIVQNDQGLFDVFVIKEALCLNHMGFKTCRAEIHDYFGKFDGIFIEFHFHESFSLFQKQWYQVWIILNFAREEYNRVFWTINGDIAVANVGDNSGVVCAEREQELEALVYHSIPDHVICDFVYH